MKKWIVAIMLLALGMSLLGCVNETNPAESPATEATSEATTEPTTEATSSGGFQAVTGDTPLSTGSGCATSAADVAE